MPSITSLFRSHESPAVLVWGGSRSRQLQIALECANRVGLPFSAVEKLDSLAALTFRLVGAGAAVVVVDLPSLPALDAAVPGMLRGLARSVTLLAIGDASDAGDAHAYAGFAKVSTLDDIGSAVARMAQR
jgi:hypothetical protein